MLQPQQLLLSLLRLAPSFINLIYFLLLLLLNSTDTHRGPVVQLGLPVCGHAALLHLLHLLKLAAPEPVWPLGGLHPDGRPEAGGVRRQLAPEYRLEVAVLLVHVGIAAGGGGFPVQQIMS